MPPLFTPATKPTMYFIGVSTRQSSINAIFPRWAERLGLGECQLRGLDFPLHDRPENYRAVVDFIRRDPLSLGALVTTHKIDLFNACAEQFDAIEPLSRSLGELSSIYKRRGALHGRSVDPESVGDALATVFPAAHARGGEEALILGAGGAGTALVWYLAARANGAAAPARIHIADRLEQRLAHVRDLHASWASRVPLSVHLISRVEDADRLLAQLPSGSLVVNATGAGKDTPGSPLSDAAVFPQASVVWEFNYRGALPFLAQARAQQRERNLRVEDGWTYFLHGWTRVISDVFDREIPPRGELFADLAAIAAAAR